MRHPLFHSQPVKTMDRGGCSMEVQRALRPWSLWHPASCLLLECRALCTCLCSAPHAKQLPHTHKQLRSSRTQATAAAMHQQPLPGAPRHSSRDSAPLPPAHLPPPAGKALRDWPLWTRHPACGAIAVRGTRWWVLGSCSCRLTCVLTRCYNRPLLHQLHLGPSFPPP